MSEKKRPVQQGSSVSRIGFTGMVIGICIAVFITATWLALNQPLRPNPLNPATTREKLFYPHEENAAMRLPTLTGDLNDIFVVPVSGHVWVVGDKGLTLVSRNKGRSWEQQKILVMPGKTPAPLTNSRAGLDRSSWGIRHAHAAEQKILKTDQKNKVDVRQQSQDIRQQTPVPEKKEIPQPEIRPETLPDFNAIFFVDKNIGWIVGSAGQIFSTVDGGRSWKPQNSGTENALLSIHFTGPRHGWATGGRGTLISTVDGGRSWKKNTSGSYNDLYSIYFTTPTHGWAAGGKGTILSTLDGGRTWNPQPSGTNGDLYSIYFTDPGHGWVAGHHGRILSTANGGRTWNFQTSDTDYDLASIHFTDPNHGWAAGPGGKIFSTADGGRSWNPQNSDTDYDLRSIYFTDPSHGWAAGRNGRILSTTDGGHTWNPQTDDTDDYLYSIHFTNPSHGWAAGRSGRILSTVDGGRSWNPQNSGTKDSLSSIHFIDSDHGWAAGYRGRILATADGGRSWNPQNSGTYFELKSIHFTDMDHGWALAPGDRILATVDGGRSWKLETSAIYRNLSSIHFTDTGHGWAAGSNGRIISTLDGGQNWRTETSGTKSDLTSIHFTDPSHGWAAGHRGTILSTLDGGRTWKTETSGTKGSLTSIHFIDLNHGWAAGSEGTILSTLDGGHTWKTETSGTRSSLESIYFTDPRHGWVAGSKDPILSTLDGGRTWNQPTYSRIPAPWYWALCLLLILISLFVLNQRGQPEQAGETVADLLASDRPLEAGDPDPLNLHKISSGLARFIANLNTEPPLTIAVTGEWGTGKSSLMNLLYHDLKQRKFYPVWFNAWHHQKGEQLLASLYANIRQQALPPLWHPSGILFRLRLLFRRGRQNWMAFGVLSFLFFAACPFLADMILSITGSMTALAKALIEKDMEGVGQIFSFAKFKSAIQGNWINALIASPAVAATLRGVRAFGLSPQRLLAFGTAQGDKKQGLDPGARTRFSREFKDVAASLDLGAMVIFIDDLDRCSKENVVEILETINFLAVSGRCFIILGMARQWVETCVALQFKELAEETGNEKTRAGDGYAHRQRFAKQYLEKLINIEVPVPVPSPDDAKALLAPQTPELTSVMMRMMAAAGKATRKYTPILCLFLLAVLSWYLTGKGVFKAQPQQKPEAPTKELLVLPTSSQQGELVFNDGNLRIPLNSIPGQTGDPHDRSLEIVLKGKEGTLEKGIALGRLGKASDSAELVLRYKPEPIKKISPSPPERQKEPPPKVQDHKSSGTTEFRPGAEDKGNTAYWLVLLAGLGLGMIGVVYLFQRPRRFTADSKTFRDALDIWHPWIVLARRTPRTIKRFLNRLRYVAMRLRSEPERRSQWERIKHQLTGQGPANRPIQTKEGVPEPILVALGAISHVNLEWVKNADTLQQLFATDAHGIVNLLKTAFPESAEHSEKILGTAIGLTDAIIKYKKEFGQDVDMLILHRQAFLEVLAETGI